MLSLGFAAAGRAWGLRDVSLRGPLMVPCTRLCSLHSPPYCAACPVYSGRSCTGGAWC
jgi:hypothetical protein